MTDRSKWSDQDVRSWELIGIANRLSSEGEDTEAEKKIGEALSILVSTYHKEILAYCSNFLDGRADQAEEVVQETFFAAWQRLTRFEGRSNFRTWLYKIAHNKAYDAKRKSDSSRKILVDLQESAFSHQDPSPGPPVIYENKLETELFKRALGNISQKDRNLLLLHYQPNLSGAEIAEILGIHPSTCRSTYVRN